MGRPYMKVCLVKTKSTYALFTKKKKKKSDASLYENCNYIL